MLYSDGVHLISDLGIEDLHEACKSMGIKRCWFHASKTFPHYDIPKRRRDGFFVEFQSVRRVTSREIIDILKVSKDRRGWYEES
jgi:hypothetical protein